MHTFDLSLPVPAVVPPELPGLLVGPLANVLAGLLCVVIIVRISLVVFRELVVGGLRVILFPAHARACGQFARIQRQLFRSRQSLAGRYLRRFGWGWTIARFGILRLS